MIIKSEKLDNYTVEVTYDSDPCNPREWDNAGTMVFRYRGLEVVEDDTDLDDFDSLDDLIEYVKTDKQALVVLPLMIYDHSGITMYVGRSGDRWDSSRVGVIYITKESCNNYGVNPDDLVALDNLLKNEVKVYDSYLTGEQFQYQVYKENTCNLGELHRDVVEACGGYLDVTEAMNDGLAIVKGMKVNA
jgi:hypothetical protein